MTQDQTTPGAAADDAGPRPPGPALRLGLIGCGRIAQVAHLPAIAKSADVRLVAVSDPSTVLADARCLRPDGARLPAGAARTTLWLHARPRRPDRDRHLLAGAAGAIFRP